MAVRLAWKVAGALGLAAGAGALAMAAVRRSRRIDLRGKVAIVTGGGRGLGFAVAAELARRGARLALCGRNPDELGLAGMELRRRGAEVHTDVCDVADRAQVERFVGEVVGRFGRVDLLFNNAGECFVGPAEAFTADDVAEALRNIFWVQYHPTMAVLPHMRARGSGRIVNITSIGGVAPSPHMAVYAAGKFAATGFSESIRPELARQGILVSTIAPPPLSDGAPLFVHFRGKVEQEFTWFAKSLTTSPLASTAEHTARVAVDAAEHGDAFRSVSPLTRLAMGLHGLAPNINAETQALGAMTLPAPPEPGENPERMLHGHEVVERSRDPRIHALGRKARADADRLRPAGLGDVLPHPA